MLKYSSISNDIGISVPTIKEWISMLESCHIVLLLPAWVKSISSQVSKSPKVYFFDTGLLCSLLGIENTIQLIRDPLRGSIFENMVVMEAYKSLFNSYKAPNLYYFRDSKGLEVDLVYMRSRNMPELYEIKASETINMDYPRAMYRVSEKLEDTNIRKTVIYSGSDISIKEIHYLNYKQIDSNFSS